VSAFRALASAKKTAAHKGWRSKAMPLVVPKPLWNQLIIDLAWWCTAVRAYNGLAVQVGVPRLVPSSFFSTDACTSWGMGGFFDGRWFSVSWEVIRRMPQTGFFPFREGCPESGMINYLELFAIYWALRLWGYLLRGFCIPARCDNTVACVMVGDLRGTLPHVPLLKEILRLQLHYDVRFKVRYIDTKANILSDLCSRDEMDAFQIERASWLKQDVRQADFEDYQLAPPEAQSLDEQVGPFNVAACCDVWGANSHFMKFWTKEMDCRLQDWDGLNVLCNPPFSIILSILIHFLRCKLRCPVGTSACFILPAWTDEEFWSLVIGMPRTFRVLRRWEVGTHLFSAASAPTERSIRKYVGGTRWQVVAVWVGPSPMVEAIPMAFVDVVEQV